MRIKIWFSEIIRLYQIDRRNHHGKKLYECEQEQNMEDSSYSSYADEQNKNKNSTNKNSVNKNSTNSTNGTSSASQNCGKNKNSYDKNSSNKNGYDSTDRY